MAALISGETVDRPHQVRKVLDVVRAQVVLPGKQRRDYKVLGEMEFIDQKRELFWQSVAADPLDFLDRVACRALGATLWYVSYDRTQEAKRPWVLWSSRLTHSLPFLALLLLLFKLLKRSLKKKSFEALKSALQHAYVASYRDSW